MIVRLLLLVALLTCPGCAYLGRRGLDFLDQFRFAAGAGTTVGVRGSALGIVDTGLLVGVKPNRSALGWRYGRGFILDGGDNRLYADQAEIIKATHARDLRYGTSDYAHARTSVAVLPAIFSWSDSTPTDYRWDVPEEGNTFVERRWIWSGKAIRNDRWAQIHAFDIEFDIAAGVYLETGYSPGETLDFLLGIFGIDIAKDDGRIRGKTK